VSLTCRAITVDEVPALRDAIMSTFGDDADEADPGGTARFRALVRPDAAWAAFDGDALVGTAATFDHAIGVPGGGTLPIAGLTMVSVRPTHRRRGILRELMKLHLAEARARGCAASGLWASEAGIYGRFGYGPASWSESLEIAHASDVRFADDSEMDTLELVDEARARELLPAIYARATADRPGALRRTETWWRERRFLETPWLRKGASRRRHALARRGDALVGYVQYRQRGAFDGGLPSGRVEIVELHGLDARAEASLWKFVLSIDLFPNVGWWCAPVDSRLPWLLADPRRVARQRADNLWLRIDDIPAALAVRSYPCDGRLRFSVDGEAWELDVVDRAGRCTPTRAPAELVFDRQTLGALYLGGTPVSTLARASKIRGDGAAIARADGLFASAVAPWCPEVF
jgi:predicted acetyltransferase